MKARAFLLMFAALMMTGWAPSILAAKGDAARISKLMRELQGRNLIHTRDYPESSILWPACASGVTPPPFPKDDFYEAYDEDPDNLAKLVGTTLDNFHSILRVFFKTASIEGTTEDPVMYTSDDFPGLPTWSSSVDGTTYSEILGLLETYVKKLKYFDPGVNRYAMEIKGSQLPPGAWMTVAEAKTTLNTAFNAATWHEYDETLPVLHQSSLRAGSDGKVFLGWMTAIRGKYKTDLTKVPGKTKIYFRVRKTTLADDLPDTSPVTADSKWHQFGDDVQGGTAWDSDWIGENIPAFRNPLAVTTFGWEFKDYGAVAISEIEPRTSPDDVSCCTTTCETGTCGPGDLATGVHSLWAAISLGKINRTATAGVLVLHANAPQAELSRSSAWQAAIGFGTTIRRDDTTKDLLQIFNGAMLATFEFVNAKKYVVRFYGPPNWDDYNYSTGLFTEPVVAPNKIITVENPSATTIDTLRLTASANGQDKISEFHWDAGTQTWALTQDGGNRIESVTKTWDTTHTERTEIRTIGDGTNVAYKSKSIYSVFPWGEELVTEILDPDGAQLTSNWTYYDNPADGNNYGKLKLHASFGGMWERFTYNADGRIYTRTTPFLNTASTAADGDCRVATHSYSVQLDETETFFQSETERIVETTQGHETGRRYRITKHGEVKDIVCQVAGASVTAATNLVTVTEYYEYGDYDRMIKSIRRPDGTMSLYLYEIPAGGGLTTTEETGQPNAEGNGIDVGTRTIFTADNQGQFASNIVEDIESGLQISAATVTAWDAGRPTEITYDDGTTETTSYAGCCGTAGSRTDRDGITTTFNAYDGFGRVLSETRLGITIIYTYDAAGRRKTTTKKAADNTTLLVESNFYDPAGRLVTTQDALSRETAFNEVMTGSQLRRTTTYPDTTTRIETYNADGSMASLSGTAAHPLTYDYTYDETAGLLCAKETRVGEGASAATEWVKRFTDFAGRNFKTTYANGGSETIYFNAAGQVAKIVDPDGVTMLYGYNGVGKRSVVALDIGAGGTPGNGTIDEGATDRVTKMQRIFTSHEGETVERTTLSVSKTDGSAAMIEVSKSDVTPNRRKRWTTLYGLTTTTVTEVNTSTHTRTVTVTRPDGIVSTATYTNGFKTAESDGRVSRTFAPDKWNRLASMTDARNGTTNYTYTDLDEIETITTPAPTSSSSPLATHNYYNASRRMEKVVLPDLSEIHSLYWETGELKRQYGSLTYDVSYAYYPQGRLKTMTTTTGTESKTTTWTYTPTRGFLSSKTYADGKAVTYPAYTLAGRVEQRTWHRGITTNYGHNSAGEVNSVTYSGGGTPSVTYGYNRRGFRSSVTDAAGSRTLTYKDDGQLDTESHTGGLLPGLNVVRDYDVLHRFHSLSVNTATAISATYDCDDGHLQTVTSGGESVVYGYHPNSHLLSTATFKRGATTVQTTSWAWDKVNRLTSIDTESADAGTIASFGYVEINSLGQRKKVTQQGGAYWKYQYDSLGQVESGKKFWTSDDSEVAGQQFGYQFDGIGNRKTATVNGRESVYTPNSANQYDQRTVPGAVDILGEATSDATVTVNAGAALRKGAYYSKAVSVNNSSAAFYDSITVQANSVAGNTFKTGKQYVPPALESFSYDDDGNQTGDSRWMYAWDGENRLVAMETKAAAVTAGVPKQKLEFVYDADCRRTAKKIYSWVSGGWSLQKEIRFVYDGWNLVAELDGQNSNALLRSYVWGLDVSGSLQGAGGVGGMLMQRDHAGPSLATYFPSYDGNGNIVALVKSSDGHARAQFEYGPFGETIRVTGGVAEIAPFRFSTKYQDAETGLIYYGFRYYNAGVGSWISRDPFGEKGGANLYRSCSNSLTGTIDYLGWSPMPMMGSPMSQTDWAKDFDNRNPNRDKKLDPDRKDQLDRGCVGLACVELGYSGEWPELAAGTDCYKTRELAQARQKTCKCAGTDTNQKLATPKLFSIHLWNDTGIDKKAPDVTFDKDGKANMKNWDHMEQPAAIDPRTGKPGQSYVNFDYGYLHPNGYILHANHDNDDPSDPMMIYAATVADWTRFMDKDFNLEVWCVMCNRDTFKNPAP